MRLFVQLFRKREGSFSLKDHESEGEHIADIHIP